MKWKMKKRAIIDFIRDFVKKTANDSLPAYAAQATFFVLLSFFPFVVLIVMLVSKMSFIRTNIIFQLLDFAPEQFDDYILYVVDDILYSNTNSFTIITLLITIWSAAKGIQALTYGLNKIYKVEKTKNYIVIRLISSLYTVIFMLICIAIMIIYIFGTRIAEKIIVAKPDFKDETILILSLQGVLSYILIFFVIILIYYQLPGRKGKLKEEFIGAAAAAFAWIAITKGFSFYVKYISKDSYMYGSLTSVVLFILWLYIEMQVILYGAEINYFISVISKKNEKINGNESNTVL